MSCLDYQRGKIITVQDDYRELEDAAPNYGTLHNNDYELKTIEKQTPSEALCSTPICLNVGHQFPFIKTSPSPLSHQEGQNETTLDSLELKVSWNKPH